MKRICVLGGGIAGLEAARRLRDGLARRRHLEVVLMDARAQSTWSPLLYDVATGAASTRWVGLELRDFVDAEEGLRLLKAQARGLDLDKRAILTEGASVPFDYLILATGARPDEHGLGVLSQGARPLRHLEDAAEIGKRVFEAVRAWARKEDRREGALTFVIAGGGPTGVELAAELASAARAELLPRVGEEARAAFRVLLVEPHDSVLPAFDPSLQRAAQEALVRHGVELVLGDRVLGLEGDQVTLESGQVVTSRHLIWAAGARGADWLADSGLPLDARGLIQVQSDLEVVGQEEIFAVGDCAAPSQGDPWPMSLHRAARQGELAAENILMDMVGASRQPYTSLHLGQAVRLGRFEAAAQVAGVLLTGRAAWVALQLYQAAIAPNLMRGVSLLGERLQAAFQGSDWSNLPLAPVAFTAHSDEEG